MTETRAATATATATATTLVAPDNDLGKYVARALLVIYLLAAAVRLVAWGWLEPPLHSDEFFQVLEPGWWRLTGVGLAPWEWRDGVRSWVLPGYHGAFMALLMALGITRGQTLGLILQLHWALCSLVLVGAAYRGGAYLTRRLAAGAAAGPGGALGGLAAALLCGVYPVIVGLSVHTLSELPSLLCFVWGLVLALELAEAPTAVGAGRRALLVGFLLSLGACIRIANGPLALVAPLVLLVHGRWRLLGLVLLGALPPVLLFGLVDKLVQGTFLASFIAYVKFNFLDGRAAVFGTAPWSWYLQQLVHRAPFSLPLVVLPMLLGLRATWPFALSGLGLVALLSTQPHKEERFIAAFWPFALIASAAVVAAFCARGAARTRTGQPTRLVRLAPRLAIAAAMVTLADSVAHFTGGKDRFPRAWLDGQAAAGDDGATALLVDRTYYSGAGLWFGGRGPQLEFDGALLANPAVSHALVPEGSDRERECRAAGFAPIFVRDGVVLLRRR